MRRHSDQLFRFSYRLFTIEFIVFKIVFFAFSLYGLYKFAERELGLNQDKPHFTTTEPQRATDGSPPR